MFPDHAAEAERRIHEVLTGNKPWPLPNEARAVLRILRDHKGARNAISIAALTEKTGLDAREVKEQVRSLVVDFKLKICGSRVQPYGYYVATSSEEIEAGIRPLYGEGVSLFRRVRALGGDQAVKEMEGQIRAALDQEAVNG
ncbi:hypothetical protein Acid345_3382 [Candidatus Koribacter versatilis Ellin345]|uniref:Helix-turn-helix type 11 domain-containing protein n=2 Tax=Candidatus Korobacter versatilis TaxID=658062 RepID=Q1IL67_KORVE|nr:hypothetical protein Acid345_3382 [Candidatus Koribacter versatilis Ellin345]